MKPTGLFLLLALLLTLPCASAAWAGFNISCSASAWRPEVAFGLAGQPADSGTLVSPPALGRVSIWGGTPGLVWTVTVRQRAISTGQWPAEAKLHLRRTSYGTGSANSILDDCSGYRQLAVTEQPLFHGVGDALGISIQVMLTGVTPGLPVRDYTSQIMFAVKP